MDSLPGMLWDQPRVSWSSYLVELWQQHYTLNSFENHFQYQCRSLATIGDSEQVISFGLHPNDCSEFPSRGTAKHYWNYNSDAPQDTPIYCAQFISMFMKWSQIDC